MAFDVGAFGWNHLRNEGDKQPRRYDWEKEHARNSGATPYQMYQLQERAKKEGVDIHKPNQFGNMGSPWDYAGYGSYGFGMADGQAMGGDLNKMRGARDWASQHGLSIGGGVREHIQGLEQQALDAQILQQQEQLAQEQNELLAQIAADEAAAMQSAAEGAEAGRLASRRGGGSQTLGASGAATFKGKGLTSSENKRGKGRGTGQFKRPYGASNLSIAATGKGNQQSTLNL